MGNYENKREQIAQNESRIKEINETLLQTNSDDYTFTETDIALLEEKDALEKGHDELKEEVEDIKVKEYTA